MRCTFEHIKDRIARNENELLIFFHDAVDRSVIEDEISNWNEDHSEEMVQADASIFNDWNSKNEVGDPSRRMRNLGYVLDFRNEEWAQEIHEDRDWLVFIGVSDHKSQARFQIPKSCTLTAFEALLKSLGYAAKAKVLSRRKDIIGLTIGW
jgi:hypothetical protein